MRETPECSQYFMKKLGGKNPEMEKWGKKSDQCSEMCFIFIFPFLHIYQKPEGGYFAKYTPLQQLTVASNNNNKRKL